MMFGAVQPPDHKITAVKAFLENQLQRKTAKAREDRAGATKNYGESGEKLFLAELELAEIEERLRTLESAIKNQSSFASDFDAIMRMEGVRKLRAKENRIVVETKRIIQTPNGAKTAGVGYDIGQFEIQINLPSPKDQYNTDAIHFLQGKYHGDWNHPNADMGLNRTCFGGFQEILLKNLADFRIVTVVHLLLSFLQLDGTPPNQRKDEKGGTRLHYSRELDLGYTNDAERNRDMTSFVKLMEFAAENHYLRISSEQKSKADLALAEAVDKFVKSRAAVKELAIYVDRLEAQAKSIGTRVDQEVTKFNNRWKKEIVGMKFEEKELRINFSFRGTVLTLVLTDNALTQLTGWPSSNMSSQVIDDDGSLKLDQNHIQKLARLQKEGKLAEVFDFVYTMINSDQPRKKTLLGIMGMVI